MSPEHDDKSLAEYVEDAVDKGATTVEEIHRAIAELPVTVLERADLLEETRSEVRRLQDASIGAVYDLIRNVNHKVARFADDLLESR